MTSNIMSIRPAPESAVDLSNVMAEASLIGAMLISNPIVDLIADRVESADFSAVIHQQMFSAIVGEVSQGRAVTAVTLRPIFEGSELLRDLGGISYLARLTADGQGLLAPRELAMQIRELADRRRMRTGLYEAIEAIEDFKRPVTECAAVADTAIAMRAESNIVESDAATAMKYALEALDSPIHGVTCGRVPSLDKVLGPLEPGSVTILAGRPGMGKSAVASSYMLGAAAMGFGTLFISLEMSRDQLSLRMIADESFDDEHNRIPYSAIQERRLGYHDRKQADQVAARLALLPMHIVDAASMTVDRLDMLVRRYKRRFAARGWKLSLVVVDYLQLLSPSTRGMKAYEAVSEVSRRLKQTMKEHEVAGLVLAQLSRDVERRPDKRPVMSDLRDSGQIEQDADAIVFLYREEYYLKMSEPTDDADARDKWEAKMIRASGNIDFIVPKRRHGTSGTGHGRFFAPYQAVR